MKQREIKFRAWNEKYKTMFYPTHQHTPFFDNLCIGFDGKIYSVGDSNGNGGWCYEDGDYVLMQFTGLLDVNQKEIYEGDILENEDNGMFSLGTVVWNDTDLTYDLDCYLDYTPLHFCRDYKIIGNIFENPELLTK